MNSRVPSSELKVIAQNDGDHDGLAFEIGPCIAIH